MTARTVTEEKQPFLRFREPTLCSTESANRDASRDHHGRKLNRLAFAPAILRASSP